MQDHRGIEAHNAGWSRVRALEPVDGLLPELFKARGPEARVLDIGGNDLKLGLKILRRGLAAKAKSIVAHTKAEAIAFARQGRDDLGRGQGPQPGRHQT